MYFVIKAMGNAFPGSLTFYRRRWKYQMLNPMFELKKGGMAHATITCQRIQKMFQGRNGAHPDFPGTLSAQTLTATYQLVLSRLFLTSVSAHFQKKKGGIIYAEEYNRAER